jgi:hypothetical protein
VSRRKVLAEVSPRFQVRREAFCDLGDVQQYRLASFLDGQTTQAGGIHA